MYVCVCEREREVERERENVCVLLRLLHLSVLNDHNYQVDFFCP